MKKNLKRKKVEVKIFCIKHHRPISILNGTQPLCWGIGGVLVKILGMVGSDGLYPPPDIHN